ncbi:MAG: dTMP kinase [Actinobacteria bacterium]|nr:dTMP kinase [Actinomycetota bacterium]
MSHPTASFAIVLIAIEGIDGAGKQTLTDALVVELTEHFAPPTLAAFPRYGNAPFGVLVEQALQSADNQLLSSVTAMSLAYAADRWQFWHIDRPRGSDPGAESPMLLDRWCASNAAYGSARLVTSGAMDSPEAVRFRDWVAQVEFGQMALPGPTLTVLLATDDALAKERRAGRNESDAYETDLDLQGRALASYRTMAADNWGGPWIVIDPLDGDSVRKPAESLAREVLAALQAMQQ